MRDLKDRYRLEQIPTERAERILDEQHPRGNTPMMQTFALVDRERPLGPFVGAAMEDYEVCGIISFHTPASHPARKVCGEHRTEDVLELKRLWADEDAPPEAERYLVEKALPWTTRDVILGYAHPEYRGIGRIFQQTNWVYKGLTEPRSDSRPPEEHPQTYVDRASERQRDDKDTEWRDQKHCYVYFSCAPKKRNRLLEDFS